MFALTIVSNVLPDFEIIKLTLFFLWLKIKFESMLFINKKFFFILYFKKS